MTSLQESQTQLHHTQGALNEQHEKTLLLSKKIITLHRSQQHMTHSNQEAQTSPTSQLHSEALMRLDRGDKKQPEEPGGAAEGETFSKSQIFSYQTPGLEILQCKYRVAVTEVVELKAEVKALKDTLAQCAERGGDDKQRPSDQLENLRRQLSSLEQSCQEGQQKVASFFCLLRSRQQVVVESKPVLLLADIQPGIGATQSSGHKWGEPGGFDCSSGRAGDAERGARAAVPSRLPVQQ